MISALTCGSQAALALSPFHPSSLHIQTITSHGGPRQSHDYTRGRSLVYAVARKGRGPNIVLQVIGADDYLCVVACEGDGWRALSLVSCRLRSLL